MKRRSLTALCLLVLVSLVVAAQTPQTGTATDPILGVWKLNVDKSTYNPGPKPAPGGIQVRQYELIDGFIVNTLTSISDKGVPGFQLFKYKLDGKDYPITALANLKTGAKPATMAYRAVDVYTVNLTPKDNTGKVTFTGVRSRVVSRDGKTMTDTSRGTNAQGQQINNVLIFDRVQ